MTTRGDAEELLAQIDDTLDDWDGSVDAMRWSPEPDIAPPSIHATRLLGDSRLIHVPHDMRIEHIVVQNTRPIAAAAGYESAWDTVSAFRRVPLREPVRVAANSSVLLAYDSETGEAVIAAVYDRTGTRVHVDETLQRAVALGSGAQLDPVEMEAQRERNALQIAAAFGVPLDTVYP